MTIQNKADNKRSCDRCGATDTRLARMDDAVMPTPERYECVNECPTHSKEDQ